MSGRFRTRPETAADAPAVRRVLQAAFPTAGEADLVDALRRDPAWLPGLSVVAVDAGGRVAGYALMALVLGGGGDPVPSGVIAYAAPFGV
ncbi:GNAT family N-acetyltransferase [Actinomadura physcomitrii]|uniref:GNAT family N-acetyltransferase n=1 Tax=Actinomadura physcomitrii TaxID=2650748 RepID=UPI0019207957|nr:hypothetical protein [Actinomadura physcomitrii]